MPIKFTTNEVMVYTNANFWARSRELLKHYCILNNVNRSIIIIMFKFHWLISEFQKLAHSDNITEAALLTMQFICRSKADTLVLIIVTMGNKYMCAMCLYFLFMKGIVSNNNFYYYIMAF